MAAGLPPGPARGWASVVSAAAVLILGLGLFFAASSRAWVAFEARPAGPVVFALGRGQAPDAAALSEGIEALERATAGAGGRRIDPAAYGSLALLRLEQARREASRPELALAEISAGVTAQRAGLERAPASGSGWARLVYAEELRGEKLRAQQAWALAPNPGDAAGLGLEAESEAGLGTGAEADALALEALEMAFLTRDLSFSLVRFRLAASLARYSELPSWLQGLARAEVLELTRYGGRGLEALVDLYVSPPGPESAALIEVELAAEPASQTGFARRLERRQRARRP